MKFTAEDALGPTSVRWDDPQLGEWEVTFTWQWLDGRLEPRTYHLAPVQPNAELFVSAVLLRKMQFGRLLSQARAQRYEAAGGYDAVGIAAVDDGASVALEISAMADGWLQRRAGRPSAYDDEHYQKVAGTYSKAMRSRRKPRPAPLQAIAEEWQVTEDTAGRWVEEARRRGHLPPTTRGRAVGNDAPADTPEV